MAEDHPRYAPFKDDYDVMIKALEKYIDDNFRVYPMSAQESRAKTLREKSKK